MPENIGPAGAAEVTDTHHMPPRGTHPDRLPVLVDNGLHTHPPVAVHEPDLQFLDAVDVMPQYARHGCTSSGGTKTHSSM